MLTHIQILPETSEQSPILVAPSLPSGQHALGQLKVRLPSPVPIYRIRVSAGDPMIQWFSGLTGDLGVAYPETVWSQQVSAHVA